jgi:signal transduction histidine kinase
VSRKALHLARKANDTADIARAFYYIGDTFEIAQKDSAYFYYREAEKIFRIVNDRERIAKMLFNKAYILFFEGNYVESEIELSKALQLLIKTNKHDLLYSSYTLMGANMEKLEEYDDAIKYYNLAQNIIAELEKNNENFDNEYNYKIAAALNISNVYEQQGQYAKSIQELQRFLRPDIRKRWPGEYSKVLANLAYSKMKSGDLEGVEQMFVEALRISENYSNSSDILYKLNNLGEYYVLKKDTAKAKLYLMRSLKIGEKIRSGEEIKAALKLLSQIDDSNSEAYETRYIFLNDSLAKAQRKNRNKYARIEYETEILEGENKTLASKYTYILGVAAVLIAFIIFLLVLRYFSNQRRLLESQRQKQLADEEIFDLLKEQQIKILQTKEQEQNRISRDLHDGILNKIYGVRLQLGLLNRSDDTAVKTKRMQYIDMLQQIEKEIRGLSHELHVDQFYDQFDYKSLLSNLTASQNEMGNTSFELFVDDEIDWNPISGLIKITIYRILQESSLNVIKYAEAETCKVSLETSGNNEMILRIEDDGKGFDVTSTAGGIGLKNMRDRAKDINATLTIDSWPGKGTQIEVRVKY